MKTLKNIASIVKKDLVSLLPLVILAGVVFALAPIMATLSIDSRSEAWINISSNFHWLGYLIAIILMVSVFQLDPASSLNHDWLTRPIPKTHWILAKLLFLFLFICIPTVGARFFVNLSNDYGVVHSLRYALAVDNPTGLLPIPLFFAISLLTSTLKKTILVTFIVAIIFISPAWDIPQPLFRLLGIDLSADYGAMMWLQALPMVFAGLLTAIGIYWLFYCRRQETQAKIIFVVGLTVFFFSMYPPALLYNWDKVLALHKMFTNNNTNSIFENNVSISFTDACFPAAILDNDSTNALVQKAGWFESDFPPALDGLTFATRTTTGDLLAEWYSPSNAEKNIPITWLVDRIRVQGRIVSDSIPEGIPLLRSFTAVNRYVPVPSADTDYWLLPNDLLSKFAENPTTHVVFDFDLALLKPTNYELKTDGQRHTLPGLGQCRADINHGANKIDIDCTKSGPQPELITAELVGVSDSRAYSDFRTASFKPDWLESIGRKHYELTIKSPTLVDSSVILINAYHVERIVHKKLISNGILGDLTSICPLPKDQEFIAIEKSSWSDKSPHEISSIAVESGVRLEVLDWRLGRSYPTPTLVLLPGLGATAHSYDDLAIQLAEKYPVVGLTRRGIGDSSKPDHGYEVTRLSQDVIRIIKTLDIESPILVGHSIGGEELSYLGAHHPQLFSGLIYLDAAYDRTAGNKNNLAHLQRYRELNRRLPERPSPRPAELVSYQAANQYIKRLGYTYNRPEGELLATYDFSNGTANSKIDNLYLDAIMMGLQAPDYKNISIPALGIFAVDSSAETSMKAWYDQSDPLIQAAVNELFVRDKAIKTEAIARFDNEVPDSEVLVLDDADHWIFLSNKQDVLDAIDQFVAKLIPSARVAGPL